MRIGFYAPLKSPFSDSASGDRTIARLLIRALEIGGHEVLLMSEFRSVAISGDELQQQDLAHQGQKVVRDMLDDPNHMVHSIDIWLTYHLYHKAPDWLGPQASEALNIPYVVTEASYAPKQIAGPWQLGIKQVEKCLSVASGVISLNPRDVECIQPLLKPKAKQLLLAPFVADSPDFSDSPESAKQTMSAKYRLNPNCPWIITVAMMRSGDKLKSYLTLADALEHITDLDWQLIVVGGGSEKDQIVKAFSNTAKRVCFTGVLEEIEIAQLLTAADVFAWPAINEAFGMAILEAHRHGLPVVAGYTDGVAATVADTQTGFLTPAGDPVSFAKAISSLIQDASIRAQMAKNARDKFLEQHTVELAAETIQFFLSQIKTQ